MSGSTIIFYLLAIITLVSGLLSVTSRNILRAAIYLLFSLIGVAGIYFWMEYEFIAAVQIVVYAGGITVLIIFSIFLTQQAGELLPAQHIRRQLFSFLAVFCAFSLLILQVYQHVFPVKENINGGPEVMEIGKQMLSVEQGGYVLPFEVISILLLAAMIGCIVIAMRNKPLPISHDQEIQL